MASLVSLSWGYQHCQTAHITEQELKNVYTKADLARADQHWMKVLLRNLRGYLLNVNVMAFLMVTTINQDKVTGPQHISPSMPSRHWGPSWSVTRPLLCRSIDDQSVG
jgi:hypothetical protein